MKKLLFFALCGIAAILVLLVVAVFAGPSLIDLRPRIANAVRDATGRELRIDGDLRVALLPKLRLFAKDIHFSNVPGASTPDMLSIDSVTLEAEVWPLLGRRLVVNSLVIDRPVANLEVDEKGRPNWEFKPKSSEPVEKKAEPPSSSASMNMQLGEFRMERGQLSYRDAASGQTIMAKDAMLRATMPGMELPADLTARMTLNDAPVNADFSIDAVGKLQRGEQARVKAALDATHATMKFDGAAQSQPVLGLDGAFDLDIPSVGTLAAWLNAPFDKAQPDPGPIQVHALFAAEGQKSVLKEATITGTSLEAKASGSFEVSGDATRVAAIVETGVLDIDRYLPPRTQDKAARPAADRTQGNPQAAATDPFASLSDQPFDLAALRRLDADVKVSIAGIKALGYEIGRVALVAKAQAGTLSADLSEIALYGGTIKGTTKLDGAGDALGVDASFKVDKVSVDQLARQAGAAPPVSGVVSSALDAQGRGKSPRALVEDMRAHLTADLGGVAVKDAAARSLSQLKLDLDVPGSDKASSLQASLVYNREPVTATASLAPPRVLVSGERFPAKLAVDSKPVTLRYDGAVQQKPVPGLDGAFDIDVPSVAKLAAWIGQPLDAKQPDPGQLRVHAALASDGAKLAIKEAAITGKAIKATAQGTLDSGAQPIVFDAKVNVEQANLDAYLPPETKQPAAKPAPTQSAGWSTEPFDLAALGAANGKAVITLAAIRYRGVEITKGTVTTTLADRVLNLVADKIGVAQGTIDGNVILDGSGGALAVQQRVVVTDVQARPVLQAFAGTDRVGGAIEFENTVKGRGRSQMDLVSSLDGAGRFRLVNGAIYGIDLAGTLRKAATLGFGGGQTEKTEFTEVSGSYTIKSGVIENRDFKMSAPVVHLTGSGTVPLPPQTIDYALEAKLVASLRGSDALGGVPIPISITGPWSDPSIEPDWSGVAQGLAGTPEKLKNLPGNLGNAAKSLGGKALPGLSSEQGSGDSKAGPDAKKSSPGLPLGIPKKLFGQ